MPHLTDGVYLLKRWDREKGVEHYGAGLLGSHAWDAGYWQSTVVQLTPLGRSAEVWATDRGWEVVDVAKDPGAALVRLQALRDRPFNLLGWNCEHFARTVVLGMSESRQVFGVIAVCCLAVAVVAAARS